MNQPINDDAHLWVSWDDYHGLVERLALIVHESGWKFDNILCLARGGLRVGDQLSRIYDLPLAILVHQQLSRGRRHAAGRPRYRPVHHHDARRAVGPRPAGG